MLTTSPSTSLSLPPALLTLPTSSRTHLCSPPSEAGAPRAPLPVLGRGEDSAQDRAIQPQLGLQASCTDVRLRATIGGGSSIWLPCAGQMGVPRPSPQQVPSQEAPPPPSPQAWQGGGLAPKETELGA